ncbi:MAG TPA: RNA pseudouridine synthase [Cryomorphaceae bacterium]|nr:RNA pseudouridine synthase [Cryomorphaceae bacterium]|tara:strand:- start:1335 stop:3005 length:1671 start_codon:yes stop_codon:yes gene_type:complete
MTDQLFHSFDSLPAGITVPEAFTYPFFYTPHPLVELASKELHKYLEISDLRHNFGLGKHTDLIEQGKMFGVLVVRSSDGTLGWLAAYSGNLQEEAQGYFVPPICDIHAAQSFYKEGEIELNTMSAEIKAKENDPLRLEAISNIEERLKEIKEHLRKGRADLKEAKKARQKYRETVAKVMSELELKRVQERLAQESIQGQVAFKHRSKSWITEQEKLEATLKEYTREIEEMKEVRRAKSNNLQREIFDHYVFLNAKGEERVLSQCFPGFDLRHPPSGSGDCAAPKLLQYAYQNGMSPVCMGEFWWGSAPVKEVRKHKYFYPSCTSRCRPILDHMLQGLTVEENPLLTFGKDKPMPVVYEDEDLVVVNKPAGLLSVPGVDIEDSALVRVKHMYPKATGAILLHRLDMSTSGLLMFTLNPKANKRMQRKFIKRQVNKTYIADIVGTLEEDEGIISLPLAPDYYDLPRQMVCHKTGKPSKTRWSVVERMEGITRLAMKPETGRTHQLRVHCAHSEGLGLPIVGDELYGVIRERLHLHAYKLEFQHPTTKELITITAPIPF